VVVQHPSGIDRRGEIPDGFSAQHLRRGTVGEKKSDEKEKYPDHVDCPL
jgi:hypothetical protein